MAKRKKSEENRLSDVVAEHIVALVEAITTMVRQDTAREIADLIHGSRGIALGRARRRRILPCIAPGCKNPSKGPRFHYLCEEHRGAPRKDWEAWRQVKRTSADGSGRSRRSASRSRTARKAKPSPRKTRRSLPARDPGPRANGEATAAS